MLLCKGSSRSEAKTRPAVAAVAGSEAGAAASVTSEILQRAYPDYTCLTKYSVTNPTQHRNACSKPANCSLLLQLQLPGTFQAGCRTLASNMLDVFSWPGHFLRNSHPPLLRIWWAGAGALEANKPSFDQSGEDFFFTTSGSRQMPHKACKHCFL